LGLGWYWPPEPACTMPEKEAPAARSECWIVLVISLLYASVRLDPRGQADVELAGFLWISGPKSYAWDHPFPWLCYTACSKWQEWLPVPLSSNKNCFRYLSISDGKIQGFPGWTVKWPLTPLCLAEVAVPGATVSTGGLRPLSQAVGKTPSQHHNRPTSARPPALDASTCSHLMQHAATCRKKRTAWAW
jgi:hypothetical protein